MVLTSRRAPFLSVSVQEASEGDSATLPETLTTAAEQVEAVQPDGDGVEGGGRRLRHMNPIISPRIALIPTVVPTIHVTMVVVVLASSIRRLQRPPSAAGSAGGPLESAPLDSPPERERRPHGVPAGAPVGLGCDGPGRCSPATSSRGGRLRARSLASSDRAAATATTFGAGSKGRSAARPEGS